MPFFTYGQNDVEFDYIIDYENPPWKLGCDSLTSQTEMNICSYSKTIIADSIMNDLYNKNLEYYTLIIDEESEFHKEDSDSSMFIHFNTILTRLKKSQTEFINYRESVTDIENAIWNGGTIRPLMVNSTHLGLTIERIKRLEMMLEENKNR